MSRCDCCARTAPCVVVLEPAQACGIETDACCRCRHFEDECESCRLQAIRERSVAMVGERMMEHTDDLTRVLEDSIRMVQFRRGTAR